MARPLPDSYRQLARYALRLPAGARLYGEGDVPQYLYLVLNGRISLSPGGLDVAAEDKAAEAGELAGAVEALTGTASLVPAVAAEPSVVVAVPPSELTEAFRAAPELALQVIETFSGAPLVLRAPSTPPMEAPPPEEAADPALLAIEGDVDEGFFFKDTAVCPVSSTRFEFLRVRTSAVRPVSRESDFRVTYRSFDPTRYAVVVCPGCGYAATQDDFVALDDDERRALRAAGAERSALAPEEFRGARSLDQAARALDLALLCYAKRAPNTRRLAVLLHRRAWVERERGDAEAERGYLDQARAAYIASFERDGSISEESAMRAAYLIGDLCLRLRDAVEGAKWLETATRFPGGKQQTGLLRMAQERLQDARGVLKDAQREAERASGKSA